MINTKNLMILSTSGAVAALCTLILTQFAPLEPLPAYLLVGFLAVILMQIMQNISKGATGPATTIKTASKNDAHRENGTVKWFDSNKGYGFITRSMGGDIFVHFRSIRGSGYRSLHEGQAVEFIVTEGDKGPQAEDILVLK